MRCEMAIYHVAPFSFVGQSSGQQGLSTKLGGFRDAREIPVVGVLAEPPLSQSGSGRDVLPFSWGEAAPHSEPLGHRQRMV